MYVMRVSAGLLTLLATMDIDGRTRNVHSRSVIDTTVLGETLSFVATNDRIRERVENISHEMHVIEALVERAQHDDVFWDVGACLGIHSFVLAEALWDGTVVAFEPMPSNRGILSDNKSINNADDVIICREALADAPGTREFAIRESVQAGYGRHSFATGDYDAVATIPVDVETGDSIVVENNAVPHPNIVKIDVEGAGPLVLEGMKTVLQNDECHTAIVETHEANDVQPSHEDYGYTEHDFIELLEDCGFSVSQLDRDYHFIGKKETKHTDSITCDAVTVEIINGNIAEESADALINSAGTTLRMGTGVAGALRRGGGEQLNEAAILNGPVDVGEAVVTPAFDLDAEYVIHAASMPHYGDGQSTPTSIQAAVRNAFDHAEELGCESVVLPLVGCGLGGVPTATGARVIRDLINTYQFDRISEIRVITYTDDEEQIVKRICR